jgi:hypothetical protein
MRKEERDRKQPRRNWWVPAQARYVNHLHSCCVMPILLILSCFPAGTEASALSRQETKSLNSPGISSLLIRNAIKGRQILHKVPTVTEPLWNLVRWPSAQKHSRAPVRKPLTPPALDTSHGAPLPSIIRDSTTPTGTLVEVQACLCLLNKPKSNLTIPTQHASTALLFSKLPTTCLIEALLPLLLLLLLVTAWHSYCGPNQTGRWTRPLFRSSTCLLCILCMLVLCLPPMATFPKGGS